MSQSRISSRSWTTTLQDDARYLFLYGVPGTGHQKAAQAIIKSLSKMVPPSDIHEHSLAGSTFPILGKITNHLYLTLIQFFPDIWDFLYDNSFIEKISRIPRTIFLKAFSGKVSDLVTKINPSDVICTQVMPFLFLNTIKNRRFRLIAVLTDYEPHSYWVHQSADLYLVPNDHAKEILIEKGISTSKIYITGIPIDPRFTQIRPKPKRSDILFMGGGKGFNINIKWIEQFAKDHQDVQTTVVCGSNQKLLREIQNKNLSNVTALSISSNVSDLMNQATCVVTKPGGISTSEALSLNKRLILTGALPGQEKRNQRFLVSKNVAKEVNDYTSLVKAFHQFQYNDQNNMNQVSYPNSAQMAADLIKR